MGAGRNFDFHYSCQRGTLDGFAGMLAVNAFEMHYCTPASAFRVERSRRYLGIPLGTVLGIAVLRVIVISTLHFCAWTEPSPDGQQNFIIRMLFSRTIPIPVSARIFVEQRSSRFGSVFFFFHALTSEIFVFVKIVRKCAQSIKTTLPGVTRWMWPLGLYYYLAPLRKKRLRGI